MEQEQYFGLWQRLVKTYLFSGNYDEAERLVCRLLEAGCTEQEVEDTYQSLQVWKFMDVRNGVLVDYDGRAASFRLPPAVTAIEGGAFKGDNRLTEVIIPATVKSIGAEAFADCPNLNVVRLQGQPETVDKTAFRGTPYDPVKRGLCLHCGGTIGVFGYCKRCNRPKDY